MPEAKSRAKTVKTSKSAVVAETPKRKTPTSKRSKQFYITIALIVLIVVGLLYNFRSLFLVAMVNGQPITRISVINDLEKQYGKQTLDSLVSKTLILQEAKNKNIQVSQSEIDEELKKIEKNLSNQGQTLDQALTLRGMTKNDLIEQVTIQKTIEKMFAKDITISDKEVDKYIEENKITPPEGQKIEDIKAQIKDQIKQQKLSDKFKTWLEGIQKSAKTTYFLKY